MVRRRWCSIRWISSPAWLRSGRATTVLAVDVGVEEDLSVVSKLTESPNALRVLWDRIRRKRSRVPWIDEVMLRSLICCSARKRREEQAAADFVFKPPVERFRMPDFTSMPEIIGVGYTHAQEVLGAVQGPLPGSPEFESAP